MAIILYDYYTPPDFLTVRGQWYSDYDNKCYGAAAQLPPDYNGSTVTREDLISRILAIHQVFPYKTGTGEDPSEVTITLTEQELLEKANNWFNQYN